MLLGEGALGEGVTSGLELVVFAGAEMRTLELPGQGTLAIGRAEGCAVRIDDPSVSRKHALLHVGATLVVEDLGSANGTIVRDRAGAAPPGDTLTVRRLVGRKAELAVGDALLFGTASVVVRHAPAALLAGSRTGAAGVVVANSEMRRVYEQAARVAPTPIGVLILGETGVGKDVLARAIHAGSSRANGPFVAVNCAAISESLVESELFGHERGAFTGAAQAREGLFEAAGGGTLLLDEVGDLSPATQAKLLRALEERVVTPVGASRGRPVDVRVIAATHRDLDAEIRAGRFRRDLYFRLNQVSLTIPPLRERRDEIAALARSLLAGACRLIERVEVPALADETLEVLRRHRWDGNVRELRNAMEHVAALVPGETILPEHLPPSFERVSAIAPAAQLVAGLPSEIRALERTRIEEALAKHGGSQTSAARALRISRRTLITRIEEYGLPRPRKRGDEPAQ